MVNVGVCVCFVLWIGDSKKNQEVEDGREEETSYLPQMLMSRLL